MNHQPQYADEIALIIDFGSQVSQLIARRLREAGIYCEVYPPQSCAAAFIRLSPKAVILSGGPYSVTQADAPTLPLEIIEAGAPILGICYGQQLLCAKMGGQVVAQGAGEFGRAEIEILAESPLFAGLWQKGNRASVWMSHRDEIVALPPGFAVLAQTDRAPFAIIADESRRIYGLQFHPEMVHTPQGGHLLANFARHIAGFSAHWSMKAFRERAIQTIRKQVGEERRVLCALSGGVDSSVTAALLYEAIGARLTCCLVDHGLSREGEIKAIQEAFYQYDHLSLRVREASKLFFTTLAGVTDPEVKRKRIGTLFIDLLEDEARLVGKIDFLAQGTIYSDVIESTPSSPGAVAIKSHHNVGGLPERMNLRLLEPLRMLFKDEVRTLGHALGLPESFLRRHPFPGPGLAIRLPGEVTQDRVALLRCADQILVEEIKNADLYDQIWQAFVVLLPVRSVGVMGDRRDYGHACVLRVVEGSDGMTAAASALPWDLLGRIATRIVNEVAGINRVLYDITAKPPATIEWE